MSSPPIGYLFCYGSLKRAFNTQDKLGIRQSLTFVAYCNMPGQLFDLGPYPAMIHGPGIVYGELFEFHDKEVLTVLDQYEGYQPDDPAASLYIRELGSCGERSVWVYYYQREVRFAERLVEGIWPKIKA